MHLQHDVCAGCVLGLQKVCRWDEEGGQYNQNIRQVARRWASAANLL